MEEAFRTGRVTPEQEFVIRITAAGRMVLQRILHDQDERNETAGTCTAIFFHNKRRDSKTRGAAERMGHSWMKSYQNDTWFELFNNI